MNVLIFSAVLTACTLAFAGISWAIWERWPKRVARLSPSEIKFPHAEILTLRAFLRDSTPAPITPDSEEGRTIFDDPSLQQTLLGWGRSPERIEG
jgi:hypothetical protein